MPNFLFRDLFDRDLDLHIGKMFNNITINTKYGAMAAATVTPIVIIGSIYIAWAYSSRAWKRRPARKVSRVLSRSVSLGVLHGGKPALERLVDFQHARADATLVADAEEKFNKLIQEEHPHFKELQRVVAKLEMAGKEADAVKKLENALKRAQTEKKPNQAYEYEMLLVEMYIYKEDFVKASKCKCLNEEMITDSRRPLYKAIMNGMLDKHGESKKYFEEFKVIQAEFEWPPGQQDDQLYEFIENFEQFQKAVQLVKKDIQKTRKKTHTK